MDFTQWGRGLAPLLAFWLIGCTAQPPSGMVLIPPGAFIMGSDQIDSEERSLELGLIKPWFEDERPARTVLLPAFYMDRDEVSNKAYSEYLRAAQAPPPSDWKDGHYPAGQETFPATGMTWFQAQSYCFWIGKRLPTEAEWEKSARGPKGRLYPWGDRFDPGRANLMSDGFRPAGAFPQGRSIYGVEDLVGNAWEWTADWYRAYPGNDRPGEQYGDKYKVIRGKSWTRAFGHQSADEAREIVEHQARASFRYFFDPEFGFGDLGFRCAKSA